MNQKPRRFPLPLSSVVGPSAKSHSAQRSLPNRTDTATPQTATRNAALDLARLGNRGNGAGSAPLLNRSHGAGPAPLLAATSRPLVSDSVRKAMVARIAQQGVRDPVVLAAMEAVPRHLFIEPALVSQAYIDASLPIGYHQTISQPYIVARMLEVMRDNERAGRLDRILEIGTGCGYQAAVLARIASDVYSIERVKPLHELAKSNLRPMRIANIRLHYGDGMLGLPQAAPFDGIILAAAGMEVPQALLDQLAIGGRLVAPVGTTRQVLELIVRVSKSEWRHETLEHCHFVPLRAGTV